MTKKPASSSSSYAAPYSNNTASYSRDMASSAISNRARSSLSAADLGNRTQLSKLTLGGVS